MKIINGLHRFEENLISLILVSMTILVFWEVIMRFVFNTGIHWSQEVTLYLSAWLVLLGASWGIRVGAHIGVDAFVKLLPDPLHRFLSLIAITLCLVYCSLFLYGSWVYLSKMKKVGIEMEDLPIQKWQAMSVLIIGFLLLTIRFLELAWNVYQGKQLGFQLADEAKESMHLIDESKED